MCIRDRQIIVQFFNLLQHLQARDTRHRFIQQYNIYNMVSVSYTHLDVYKRQPTILPTEVIRSTTQEKEAQIAALDAFKKRHEKQAAEMLEKLQEVAVHNGNIFAELMETVKFCSLGQITNALYSVGGQYRRNM